MRLFGTGGGIYFIDAESDLMHGQDRDLPEVSSISGQQGRSSKKSRGGDDAVGNISAIGAANQSCRAGNAGVYRDDGYGSQQCFNLLLFLVAECWETEKLDLGDGGNIKRGVLRKDLAQCGDRIGIVFKIVNNCIGVESVHRLFVSMKEPSVPFPAHLL